MIPSYLTGNEFPLAKRGYRLKYVRVNDVLTPPNSS